MLARSGLAPTASLPRLYVSGVDGNMQTSRRKKSSLERREQRQRAAARHVGYILKLNVAMQHRGAMPTREFGRIMEGNVGQPQSGQSYMGPHASGIQQSADSLECQNQSNASHPGQDNAQADLLQTIQSMDARISAMAEKINLYIIATTAELQQTNHSVIQLQTGSMAAMQSSIFEQGDALSAMLYDLENKVTNLLDESRVYSESLASDLSNVSTSIFEQGDAVGVSVHTLESRIANLSDEMIRASESQSMELKNNVTLLESLDSAFANFARGMFQYRDTQSMAQWTQYAHILNALGSLNMNPATMEAATQHEIVEAEVAVQTNLWSSGVALMQDMLDRSRSSIDAEVQTSLTIAHSQTNGFRNAS